MECIPSGFDVNVLLQDREGKCLSWLPGAAGIYELEEGTLRILCVNDQYYQCVGELPGEDRQDTKDALSQVWEEDHRVLMDACVGAREDRSVQTVRIRRRTRSGMLLWLEVKLRVLGIWDRRCVFCFLIDDVTEQKRLEAELLASREQNRQDELCRMMAEDSGMVMYDYDVLNDKMFYSIPNGDGQRRSWDIQRFSQYIKQSPLVYRDDVPLCLQHIQNMKDSAERNEFEQRADYYGDGYRWYRTSYRPMRGDDGTVERVIGHAIDIMEARRWKERAEKDGLTGLLNRQTMEIRVNDLLRRKNFRGTFFLFDVDDFKKVNDTCGHTIGDSLLMCISHIFERNFREEDLKSRLGGDELAVLTVNAMEEAHIQRRAEVILKEVRALQDALQMNIPVSISVGIASANEGTWSFENLYQRADVALYEAKHAGKNQFYIV